MRSGRGLAWDGKLRKLYMKTLTLDVPPNSANEVSTSSVIEMIGADCCGRDLHVPDNEFVRKLRLELGVLQETCAGVAIAQCARTAALATDASPLSQIELAALPVQLVEEDGSRRTWCAGGAYETADQTAGGEAAAVAA